ncbi:PKD domain-containing protein, partial [Methanophagales archaeon]
MYPKIYWIYQNTTVSQLKAIDPTVLDVAFLLSWQSNSSNLNLTLYKPYGSVAEDVNITHEKNTTLAYEYYTVPSPEPGNWTLNITAIDVPEEGENYSVMVYLISNLTLFLSTENYWCNLNEPMTVAANLTNESAPFTGANVTAEIYKPDDSVFNITLFDDGTHGDAQANDGIYSNTFIPSMEGTYYIIAYASGTILSHYFTREAVTEIAVREQTVKFTDNYSDYGTDTDGDGLYTFLTVEAEANVTTAGNYTVDALLHDENGTEVVSISNYTFLDAGIQTLELNFDGISIYNHKANGTYNLSLELYDEYGTPIDYRYDAYTTSAYNYTDFQRPSVALTGYYSDYGTDTDGNGLYDYLTIEVGVNVANSGDYAINARIMTDAGEEIIWASDTSYLTADQPETMQLNFDGRYIYGTMTNGSYHLRDVYVYNIDDSTLSDHVYDAYTTSAYNYTDFEKAGFIIGKVTDINETPISNALVSATGISVYYDYTDTFGNYSLMVTQNGTYTVTVTPPPEENLAGDSASVYVTVGETTFCNFTLREGGIIAGRVTDVNGTGIANARVETTDITHTILKYNLTNSTGYYSIKGLPNNTYVVTAYPPYGANLVTNSTTVTVTQGQTTFYNFILKEGGTITGKVTYENGTGISDVEVEARGPGYGWTYTNATGDYTISGLETGTYTVTAYPLYGSNLVSNTTTAIVTAGETTVVNLILHPPATITGRITDENGTGIYNAYVDIWGPSRGSTYTNTSGYYTITGLEEGFYHVYAYPPSGTNLISNSTDVFVKAGQTTTVNLILEEGGILTGRVTDTNGTSIYNARVSASGPSWGSDYTDSSGYYEIVGLQTGTYRIETHGQTGTNLVNVTCAKVTQKETTTLNVMLHEGGMIKGRVTDEYGAGMSNAYVRTSGPIYVSANTDYAGYYTIEGLINGTYIVTVEGSYGSGLFSNPVGADINEGETIEINFTLRTGGVITGRVTDENGLPIAYVDVEAFPTRGYGSYEWAYTDYDGYYTIAGLQSGEYVVTAYGSWYGLADNSTTAFVQLGETTTVNFILQEGGTLTGEVTYENGTAAPFVEVFASGESFGRDETGLNGYYTITGLQDGKYTIIASEHSTNLVDSTTAIVTSGETTTANLTLHEGGIVKGRVTDINGTGIANAWIDIYIPPPTGYYWYWYGYYNGNQTNSTGYYIIEGVPNGTFNITASPSYGYCGDERDLVENSSIITVVQSQTTVHDFILQEGGAIKGRVTTQAGIPVAGAFISAEGLSYGYTYTCTDGNYTITRLQAGTYKVSAYPPSDAGLASNGTSADVSAGQTTLNVDIVLMSDQPPVASFSYAPVNPVVNQIVTFNASSSYDPDGGNIINYKWNFGDGNITNTTEAIITHSYSEVEDYIVNLTVRDDEGAKNATSKTITVSPFETLIFDTGKPDNSYPSIFGTHNGTIKLNQTITVKKLYTYPCPGTGGHTEYARIWNSSLDINATWNGYVDDWHNISFN